MERASSELSVRAAVPGDAEAIAILAAAQRAHHGDPTDYLSADKIRADGFGPKRAFDVVLAEADGTAVGYALFHAAYEPAYAARGLYLADLFVAAEWRRRGVGRLLVETVVSEAKARGGTFVWWLARESNADARAFYSTLGLFARADVVAHAKVIED